MYSKNIINKPQVCSDFYIPHSFVAKCISN